MKQWIKLSAGVHKDRKLWKLSKDAQLTFFYLLSLAGAEDNNGILPPVEDIALELWFLRLKNVGVVLRELLEAGIIEETQSDEIKLTNFEKWQTSEKTKSEIDREYYLKNKKLKSESQRNLSENSAEIKRNLSEQSEKISENSAKIPTLEIDKEIDIDKDKELREIKESVLKSAPAKKTPAKPKPEKHTYGSFENVLLTDVEAESLRKKFTDADARIEYFSTKKKAKGYVYKSDYAAILAWADDDVEKAKANGKAAQKTVNEYPDIYTQLKAEGVL